MVAVASDGAGELVHLDKTRYLSHMYRYLLLLSLLLFSACFVSKGAKDSKKKEKKPTIEYGMTHEEVLSLITDRSERIVAEFNYPQGHLVAYQYARYGRASMKQAQQYMYFLNA